MTADIFSNFYIQFLTSLVLAAVAFYLSYRRRKRDDVDTSYRRWKRDALDAALRVGITTFTLTLIVLGFLFRWQSTTLPVFAQIGASLASFLDKLRWFHLLILAAVATTYPALRYYLIYRGEHFDSSVIRAILLTFVRYSLNLLILYYLYLLTGSIALTALAAALAAATLLLRAYLYRRAIMRRFPREPWYGYDDPGGSKRWPLLRRLEFYIPGTLLPALAVLVVSGLTGWARQGPAAAPGGPDSTWVYLKFVLWFLAGAAILFGIIMLMSYLLGGSRHDPHARSEYRSRLWVGAVRLSVLALFVLPAGLSLGGEWRAYAAWALALYALLEWLAAAAHARLAYDSSALVHADE